MSLADSAPGKGLAQFSFEGVDLRLEDWGASPLLDGCVHDEGGPPLLAPEMYFGSSGAHRDLCERYVKYRC
jgi:hypothetical protein